jgi:hypothetical protein
VIVTPTPTGFVTGGRVSLIEDGTDGLKAWAERYIRSDPDIRWLVGNYVEADKANNNGHIFPLEELQAAQKTLAGKPLNMLHRAQHIVGFFAGAQLVDAAGHELPAAANWATTTTTTNTGRLAAAVTAANAHDNPYVEAVAGLWHSRFPDEYYEIQRAHKEGTLFLSMEAIPKEVSCPTCDRKAVFAGFESESYCDHMQGATGPKRLHEPCFAGGAVIIPPIRPGWDHADIRTIAHAYEGSEDLTMAIANEMPELGVDQWEWLMAQVVGLANPVHAREFSTQQRQKLAKKGNAMPDGSYPIANVQDLKNAIQAIGRAPAAKRSAVKSHIKKRARALGAENLIPPDW